MQDEIIGYNDDEYIIIPNPIYDVVFKYLMEDNESAKIIISTLINENIKSIQLEPVSHSAKITGKDSSDTGVSAVDDIRLFHLDFTATVELPDGTEELIMIELQKASEPNDIFRFKRYISRNFQKKNEVEIADPVTGSIINIDRPVRLIPIFILNFRIENEINDLLIRTNKVKTGVFKEKELTKFNEFIDHLTYDILVVQLPNLNNITEDEYKDDIYKSKLYSLMKIFDQKSKVKSNKHRLRLIRKFFPGFLERVIKRLQSADIANPDIEEEMHLEDEYLRVLEEKNNLISFMNEQLIKQKEAIEEQQKEIDEQQIIIKKMAKLLESKGVNISDL